MTFSLPPDVGPNSLWSSRACANLVAGRPIIASPARRSRAHRLGAVYWALSSVDHTFSDRAHPAGAGVGTCRKESPLSRSSGLGRFHIGACNLQCHRCLNSSDGAWLEAAVTQARWLPSTCGAESCVAALCWLCWMLHGRIRRPASEFHLRLRAGSCGWSRIVDGVSRRPAVAGRKSSDRAHAGRVARLARTAARRQRSHRRHQHLLLHRPRRTRFRSTLRYLPRTV